MKNPLTSKERRGLVAVAAAALLCVSSGFIFRNCTHPGGGIGKSDGDNLIYADSSAMRQDDRPVNGKRYRRAQRKDKQLDKDTTSQGKSRKRGGKKKAEKVYPVRDPLSQPCD